MGCSRPRAPRGARLKISPKCFASSDHNKRGAELRCKDARAPFGDGGLRDAIGLRVVPARGGAGDGVPPPEPL
eukprot:5835670-Lingulodinium_polyedra.AAC.1